MFMMSNMAISSLWIVLLHSFALPRGKNINLTVSYCVLPILLFTHNLKEDLLNVKCDSSF